GVAQTIPSGLMENGKVGATGRDHRDYSPVGENDKDEVFHQRGSICCPSGMPRLAGAKNFSRRAFARSFSVCSDWSHVPIIVICWDTRPRNFWICATCCAAI